MQQHKSYVDRRRCSGLIKNSNKTRFDDFYTKLERIRLSAATSTSKQYPSRTATELLDESKAFFVKSQEVLHNRQTLSNNQQKTPTFRTAQPRRCPYQDYQYDQDRLRLNLSFKSATPPDSIFESVSVLSLSDQTTLDSTNSPSVIKRTAVSSSLNVIERNARIIKWLFQLHKANESSPS